MLSHRDLLHNASSNHLFLILGYGMTGQALARFLESQKRRYVIFDEKDIKTPSSPYCLDRIDLKQGSQLLLENKISAIFPSPGVSLQHTLNTLACQSKVPIIGELELASFYLKGDFIAVTGTNGKSTTAMLISALLKDAGVENRLSGNIGAPLIDAVNEPPFPYYVIEESSYQLELVGTLRHHIAICLNITEDHFDRYQGIDDYAQAKANIIKNSTSDDWLIYNHDDVRCLRLSRSGPAQNMPFSLVNRFSGLGAQCEQNNLLIRLHQNEFCFDLGRCSLKGLHNHENMLASLSAAIIIDSSPTALASYQNTLANFVGLPHRMQKIHSSNGIDYYDDSKATNVDSVVMALASFDGNVILIAGGQSKHCDYTPLKGIMHHKVKTLILLGEAQDEMHDAFHDQAPTERVANMREAVTLAKRLATSGDVVLLSPACASFDQYQNYKERGNDFQQCAKTL